MAAVSLAAFSVAGVSGSAALASSPPVLTWTKQSPATHPVGRDSASMAYDAATGNMVLFGGYLAPVAFGDTWTWDGSTWTKQVPATSPPARGFASMAYNAATRNIVLFGGLGTGRLLGDTWTWGSS